MGLMHAFAMQITLESRFQICPLFPDLPSPFSSDFSPSWVLKMEVLVISKTIEGSILYIPHFPLPPPPLRMFLCGIALPFDLPRISKLTSRPSEKRIGNLLIGIRYNSWFLTVFSYLDMLDKKCV